LKQVGPLTSCDRLKISQKSFMNDFCEQTCSN
jgi:hypothetical protein